ncbi:hypothetical protein CZ809_02020 [Photobacterium piscicola]|uniref:Uncharacterized protein n=1 Tax=Photobacterium piscicola TaxID=1378299 RepID=A0A1T5I0C8_9GAMM|nr:hypothetical protein CZ809_02020 [Photobacterium piscicola]
MTPLLKMGQILKLIKLKNKTGPQIVSPLQLNNLIKKLFSSSETNKA